MQWNLLNIIVQAMNANMHTFQRIVREDKGSQDGILLQVSEIKHAIKREQKERPN